MTPSLHVGAVVRIRGERWRILSLVPYGETCVVEAAGMDGTNRADRTRFLLPFEPVDRLLSHGSPRIVRPSRWRRIVRGILSDATPSWTSLRAPAHARLTLLPFQLEPTLALVRGDACRFLLADAVGLGKTVQAGLMIAEMVARRPASRVLIVSPAALRDQWREELHTRFSLDADVLDAAGIARLTPSLPPGVNPWSVARIAVTSIDYLKRPEVLRSLESLVWDLVVLDEAHNLGGRSDRAAAAHAIGRRSRAVALLTATPHSGDDEAFRRLCGIGDVQGGYPLLMFRRTRRDAGDSGTPRTIWLRVRPTAAESLMHAALMAYARAAWRESIPGTAPGARLAMAVLTRRACSSAGSLARSVERRLSFLRDAPSESEQIHLPFFDMASDDEEPQTALAAPGLRNADDERARLGELLTLAAAASADESKPARLRRFLQRTAEPAIVFTEYRDTLQQLAAAFADLNVLTLHGGLTARERRDVLSRFTTGNGRLLIATDAASEGLNLHQRCRLVINLELPWTPVRLAQRTGRVDRIGQSRRVHAIRLVAKGTCEETILARLAQRLDRMRNALGPMPDERVVAESVIGLAPMPVVRKSIVTAGLVTHVDLKGDAIEEAVRLRRVKTWLTAADPPESRAVVTSLRSKRTCRRDCICAFLVGVANASDQLLWHTIVAARWNPPNEHSRPGSGVRALFTDRAVDDLLHRAHGREVESLRNILRAPLALWIRRESDLMSAINQDHARMSASLLQPSLFDRRIQRQMDSQAALRDEALARCRVRLEELRACEHLRPDRLDLVFGVLLE